MAEMPQMASARYSWGYVGLLLMAIGMSESYSILLAPCELTSHMLQFTRLAIQLSNRGYNVTLALPSNYELREKEINRVNIERYRKEHTLMLHKPTWVQKGLQAGLSDSFWQKMDFLVGSLEQLDATAELMVADTDFIKRLEKRRFDLALVDYLPSTMYLAYKLSIPYATYGIYCDMKYIPHQPSYIPGLYMAVNDRMTFLDRVLNTIWYFWEEINHLIPDNRISRIYISEKPPVTKGDLTAGASACFIHRSPETDFARPLPPHAIYLGPVIFPTKPLPSDIQKFINDAASGFIVVSFGTWMNKLPPEVYQIMFDVFKKLDQRVVMVCPLELKPSAPDNVLLLPWLPQSDLLSQKNAKLLIYHGGANSMFEVAYHGVPSIIIPFLIDQYTNALLTKSKGYGAVLDVSELTVENLYNLIQKVLKDEEIGRRAREVSSIAQEKPNSGLDALDYWVKYLIKYGDKFIKSETLYTLPYVVYKGYDVSAFLLSILCCLCICVYMSCVWMCSYCRNIGKIKTD